METLHEIHVKAQGREPLCGEASPWSAVLETNFTLLEVVGVDTFDDV